MPWSNNFGYSHLQVSGNRQFQKMSGLSSIVEQNLPDPTSLSGAFKGKDAAMEGIKAAINTVTRKANNLNSVYETQGVSLKEFKKNLAPLNPEALNLYKNPPSGYSKKEIDDMFLAKFGRLPSEDELK